MGVESRAASDRLGVGVQRYAIVWWHCAREWLRRVRERVFCMRMGF